MYFTLSEHRNGACTRGAKPPPPPAVHASSATKQQSNIAPAHCAVLLIAAHVCGRAQLLKGCGVEVVFFCGAEDFALVGGEVQERVRPCPETRRGDGGERCRRPVASSQRARAGLGADDGDGDWARRWSSLNSWVATLLLHLSHRSNA